MKSINYLRIDDYDLPLTEYSVYSNQTSDDAYIYIYYEICYQKELWSKENFFFQLVNNYMNAGKKKKASLMLFNSFKKFYFISSHTTKLNELAYSFWKEYQYNVGVNLHIYNITFLINWVASTLKPIFNIQCQNVPKKYRKHLKTHYVYKVKYLYERKRFKAGLKWIGTEILTAPYRTSNERVFYTILDSILNFKNSKAYKTKISIYSHLLLIK